MNVAKLTTGKKQAGKPNATDNETIVGTKFEKDWNGADIGLYRNTGFNEPMKNCHNSAFN